MFNLSIYRKLRGCDLGRLRILCGVSDSTGGKPAPLGGSITGNGYSFFHYGMAKGFFQCGNTASISSNFHLCDRK